MSVNFWVGGEGQVLDQLSGLAYIDSSVKATSF